MRKFIKCMGFICLEFVVIAACIFMGVYINSKAQEKSPLTINKIALINLDEGVSLNGIQKYYAMEFIGTLKDNFEMTSLEHARLGLENNLYAAYIIIPAAFSKNVESINKEPVKSNILFKMNPELENTVRESVIADITAFNDELGTNMEYVYLDAILKEVHDVQDDSSGILENDKKDVENILKFTKTGLVTDPEYPEMQHIDSNIKELNLADTYSKLQSDLTSLSDSYQSETEKAQDAYNKMIASSAKMNEQLGKLDTELEAFESLQLDRDEKTNNIKAVEIFADNCNSDFQKWKGEYNQQILDNYNEYIKYEYAEQLSASLEEMVKEHKEYMKDGYYEIMRERAYNEVEISFDSKQEKDLYIQKASLETIKCVNRLYDKFLEVQDQNDNIKKQLQNELKNIKVNEVKEADIERLMKLTNEIINEIPDNVLLEETNQVIEEDINVIAQMVEKVKNKKWIESAKVWLCNDLEYYGTESKEDIGLSIGYLSDFPDKESISDIIDTYYNPEITLPMPLLHRETLEEDITEGSSTEKITEAKGNRAGEPVTENTEETDEDDVTEGTTEDTTEEAGKPEVQQSEIEKKLFQYTDDPEWIDVQNLSYEVEETIIEPIVSANCSNITSSFRSLDTLWTAFNTGLSGFSIESYGNQKEKVRLETDIKSSVNKIQAAVSEKGKEYTTYISQANELNNKNLTAWEKSIKTANQSTHTNIKKELSSIMENRQRINTENNELLESVIAALPYSRLGHLENRKMYTYITNPLEYEDLSVQRSTQIQPEQKVDLEDGGIQKIILILLGGGVCLAGGLLIIREMKHRNKSLNKQDLL